MPDIVCFLINHITEIKITKVLVKDAEGNIDGEVRERMKAHIVEKYGCEVEFEE